MCMNAYKYSCKFLGVSRIVNLIFVAVFEGPIMLLTTVKFIFMQYQYIHCSTSLYVHTPSLKKYNFCHKQIYLSLARKGLIITGNVFTGVFQSFCSRGWRYRWSHVLSLEGDGITGTRSLLGGGVDIS